MDDFDSQWNPMKDHHDAPEGRTYDSGPGKGRSPYTNERQHGRPVRVGNTNYNKLFIRNISEKINKEALENIFSRYGTVVDAYVHRKKTDDGGLLTATWGTVTYDNKASAQKALEELNNHPDHKFKIDLYVDNEKDMKFQQLKQERIEAQNRSSVPVFGYQNSGHGYEQAPHTPIRNPLPFYRPSSSNTSSREDNVTPRRPVQSNVSQTDSQVTTQQAPIPACMTCGRKTLEQCKNCRLYYCTKKCMVLGYETHRGDCITVAPHTTDPEPNGWCSAPATPSSRIDQTFSPKTGMAEFSKDLNDYRRHQTTTNTPFSPISNTYDNDEIRPKKPSSVSSASELGYRTDGGNQPRGDNRTTRGDAASRTDHNRSRYDNQNRSEAGYQTDASAYQSRSDNRNARGDASKTEGNRSRGDAGGRFNNKSQDDRSHNNNNRCDAAKSDSSASEGKGDRFNKSHNAQSGGYTPKKENTSVFQNGTAYADDAIKFAPSSSKSDEKRKSDKKVDDRDRSRANGAVTNNEDAFRQANRDPGSPPAYVTNRRSYNEGDKLQVRISETRTDTPDYSSIRIVDEESLLPKLTADMMRETSLPSIGQKKGVKCIVCCSDDERRRGILVSENPLQVKFIDYGFCPEACEAERLRGCPDIYGSVKPFAYKVKFLNAKQVDLESYANEKKAFEIRIVKKHKDLVWEAEIMTEYVEGLDKARQRRASRDRSGDSSRPNKPEESAKKTSRPNKPEEQPVHFEKLVLEEDTPVEVFVSYVESDGEHFYIAVTENLKKMYDELAGKTFSKLETIEGGPLCMCLAPQDGEWYRARITEKNPIKVHFVDFGNTHVVSRDDLKMIPTYLSNVEPLATRVKLAKGKVADYGICENGKHLLRPLIWYSAEGWVVISDERLDVTVTHTVSKDTFYVLRKDVRPKLEEYLRKFSQLPRNPPKSEPAVGKVYLNEYEGELWRAKLIKESPHTVLYIDYGNEEEVEIGRLFELPNEWQLPPLAFKVTIVPEPTDPVEEGSTIRIKAKNRKEDIWEIIAGSP